jgi:hypothetical protein
MRDQSLCNQHHSWNQSPLLNKANLSPKPYRPKASGFLFTYFMINLVGFVFYQPYQTLFPSVANLHCLLPPRPQVVSFKYIWVHSVPLTNFLFSGHLPLFLFLFMFISSIYNVISFISKEGSYVSMDSTGWYVTANLDYLLAM